MKQSDIAILLNFIQALPPSQENDEVTAAVLRIVADYATLKTKPAPTQDNKKDLNYLKFTQKEINSMPEPIKILLVYSGNPVRYRFHNNCYQARYRRDGYNIEVCAPSLDLLRIKFLDRISHYVPKPQEDKRFPRLKDFIADWLKVKEITVKASTMNSYVQLINLHIIPTFGDKRLNVITRAEIQSYLSDLVVDGKNRTAQKLKQLLSAIFDVAAEDFNLKSPMAKVVLPHYEINKGNALTKAEEKTLVDFCISKKHTLGAPALLLLLYTGMRVAELSTAVMHDRYIECETAKIRHGYAKVFRKIPITPMMRKVLPYIDFERAKNASKDCIKTAMKSIFPNHHPHELRYTFITRCKEAGCNQELVMLWDGHKFDKDVKTSVVDRGYTDYSEEYYFSEAEKVNYEL